MSKNKTVIDLFAGAGGFGLGFELAEYNLQFSLEVDQWAVETLFVNHKDNNTTILCDDIRKYSNLQGIKHFFDSKPDIIIGGPPCQGFSYANSKTDPNDPRNTLFMDFANWVEYLQPEMFVMENVAGLLHRKNAEKEKVIEIIRKKFEHIGYKTSIWQLNAAHYGVPQSRIRIFIIGSKTNEVIPPPARTHYLPNEPKKIGRKFLKPAITISQAISDLPDILSGQGEEIMLYNKQPQNDYQKWARKNSNLVYNHVAMKHTKRSIERYQEILNGKTYDELPENLRVRKRNGNGAYSETKFQSNYRHLRPDMVSFTIPASFYSNFIHPTIARNITSREAARIQSFPDNYLFRGKRTQISSKLLKKLGKEDVDHLSQYNQIGNAVPPLLAKAIAEHLKNFF